MNADQYQLWKEHPQTKEFFQYLQDYRKALMEKWAQGGLSGDENLMAIARAQMAEEIVDMDDEGIREFYRTFKGEESAE
jgi:hypothetical protein